MNVDEAMGIANSLRRMNMPADDETIEGRQTGTVLALADEVARLRAPVLPADAWGPVAMPWRLVLCGDIILDHDGAPWMVTERSVLDGLVSITARIGARQQTHAVNAEDRVHVLVPLAERDAIIAARAGGLGPTVLDRAR